MGIFCVYAIKYCYSIYLLITISLNMVWILFLDFFFIHICICDSSAIWFIWFIILYLRYLKLYKPQHYKKNKYCIATQASNNIFLNCVFTQTMEVRLCKLQIVLSPKTSLGSSCIKIRYLQKFEKDKEGSAKPDWPVSFVKH